MFQYFGAKISSAQERYYLQKNKNWVTVRHFVGLSDYCIPFMNCIAT